ncbi:unnamed protein product [Ectocarpus sp. 12 AP-2014]
MAAPLSGAASTDLSKSVKLNLNTRRSSSSISSISISSSSSSSISSNGSAQRWWRMAPCSFCRSQRVANSNEVFACYKMNAHHREVELVDAEGARDGVGILSARSELQKNHVLPKQTERLGTFGDLDPDSTLNSGDGVTFIVSCDECAGFSLGLCIDKGHCQQERYANSLPERSARRVRRRPPPPLRKKTTKTSKASPSTKKPTGGGGGGGGKGGVHETGKARGVGEARGYKGGGAGRGENTTSKRGGAAAAASPGARGGGASAGGAETCPGGAVKPSVIKDPGAEGGGGSAYSRKATGKRPVSGNRGKGEPAGGDKKPTLRGVGVSAATTEVGEGGRGERNTSAEGGGEEVEGGIEKSGGGGGGRKHSDGGGESVQGAKKRPRSSSGEGVVEGSARGGGGMQLSSSSPKVAAPSSDKRRRLLEETLGGRLWSAREDVVSSPRRSTPKRSKVDGVDASAPVAPVVVERLPKSVIVSDTDEERSAKAACGERRGGGSEQRQDHVGDGGTTSRPQKAPAFGDGRDWYRNTVVPLPPLPPSPSSPGSASAVLTASASGKEPAAVVTGESGAARRAISPSSASSSSCVSFSTPSLSVVDAGAGVGPKSSGGKRRSAEPSGGRGETADAANGGSAKTSTLSKRRRGPDKLDTASGGMTSVSGGEVVGSARSGGGRTAAPQRAGAKAGRGEGKKDAGAQADANGGPPQMPGPAVAASCTTGCAGAAVGAAAAAALPSRFASSAPAGAVSTPAPSLPAAAAAGIGKSARPGPAPTTTTSATSQCPRKKIELAKFEAIQNQAYRQAQEYCRKQLAPLEAERRAVEAKLEAMKQTLRKTMRDAHERRVSEIEAFKANLYSGTDATAGGS